MHKTSQYYEKNIVNKPKIIKKIMKMLGDQHSFTIINDLIANTSTIENIIKKNNIPPTSTYRKINEMVKMGVINEHGHEVSKPDGRKIKKYTTSYKSISIKVRESLVIIEFIPKKECIVNIR